MKTNHKIIYFFLIIILVFSFIFWIYIFRTNILLEEKIGRFSFADIPAGKVCGGIIPHHLLAREKIKTFFDKIKKEKYDTVVLIGPDHFSAAKHLMITSVSDTETPHGKIQINKEAVEKLVKNTNLTIEEAPFKKEHSIFNLTPYIKEAFPKAELIPVILNFNAYPEQLEKLADELRNNLNPEKTLVLASVDFSHYQPVLVADFHDQRSNSIISNFDMERIYSMEVDSPPSIYALLSYLSLINCRESELLSHTNSGTMMQAPDDPTTSHNIFSFTNGDKENNSLVNFLFFGDTMLDRDIKLRIEQNGFEYLLEKIAGEEKLFFKGVDYIAANLEGVFADNGSHYSPEKENDFSFNPKYLKELKKYNFNFFNLANNHAEDQSEKGFKESIDNLDKNNFLYSGCLGQWRKECGVKILNMADKNIAMFGINYFSLRNEYENILKEIEKIDKEVDYVIINIHWGIEYAKESTGYQKEIAHDFIDRGADLIIGHHPHVVQEMEIYNNKPIFYSLGNFIFDQYFSKETQEGLAVGVSLSDKAEIFLFPFKSIFGQLELMKGEEKNNFLDNFEKKSSVGNNADLNIKSGRFSL